MPTSLSAKSIAFEQLRPWRDLYRHEMNCQVLHDSLHTRPSWTISYQLNVDDQPAGYGSIVLAGPWKGKPTVFEFYVLPRHRTLVFRLFETFLAASKACQIETQSNDPILTTLLHTYSNPEPAEAILFHDQITTDLPPPAPETRIRPALASDLPRALPPHEIQEGEWILELDGSLAASGGILYHYNRPHGDIYMHVAEPFRRKGVGSFLVQELKKICYAGGSIPTARCNRTNIASLHTLQKAGFVPFGVMQLGILPPPARP